jgi:hypothetical protein
MSSIPEERGEPAWMWRNQPSSRREKGAARADHGGLKTGPGALLKTTGPGPEMTHFESRRAVARGMTRFAGDTDRHFIGDVGDACAPLTMTWRIARAGQGRIH